MKTGTCASAPGIIRASTLTPKMDMVYVMNVVPPVQDGGKRLRHTMHSMAIYDLWIAPEDNQRMIIADDGGGQVSFDAGENWSTYNNQPTAQHYRVTTDNNFPYRIYGAQQDNSTQRIPPYGWRDLLANATGMYPPVVKAAGRRSYQQRHRLWWQLTIV